MKSLVLFILVWFWCLMITGQVAYVSTDVCVGNYVGLDIGANYVLKEKLTFQFSYSSHIRQASSRPDDYSCGLAHGVIFGLVTPHDKYTSYNLMMGRLIRLNSKGSIRLNLMGGIGVAQSEEPVNWVRYEDNLFYENYGYDYEKKNHFNLAISPRVEFSFSRYYGLSVTPQLKFNRERAVFGLAIGQVFGILKKK